VNSSKTDSPTPIDFSAIFELHGQRLCIDRAFEQLLANSLGVHIQDIEKLAKGVCEWMESLGWFILQRGVAFVVDQIPHPENLFTFYPRESSHRTDVGGVDLTCTINAHETKLKELAKAIGKVPPRFEKLLDPDFYKAGLRECSEMTLAHELTHAFGMNRRSKKFGALPLQELEMLTDACAFLSCEKLIGGDTYLGANYLAADLTRRREKVTADRIRKLAESVVASAKPKSA
jgi:hypothetical protein